MPNWKLIGNTRAIGALSSAVADGSPARSYVFAGPDRVGKAAAAIRLAQALNCTGDNRPCLSCEACRRIGEGKFADVITLSIAAAGDGPAHKEISVDQMRQVEGAVALAPYEGRMRVAIIDPAEAMSEEAQNAFLKTLEEPPPHALFVLITDNPEALLETVRSRCRRIDFRLASVPQIAAGLAERGVEAEQAALLARLAAGRPGWALAAAESPVLLEKRREALDTARSLGTMSLADRIDLAESMSNSFKRERAPVDATLEEWLSWWRDVMLAQSGAPEAIANEDRREEIEADGRRCDPADVRAFVQALRDTRQFLRGNVQSRIALDALMLRAPTVRDGVLTS